MIDLSNLGHVLKSMGDHRQALAAMEEAHELAERTNNPVKQVFSLHGASAIYSALGDVDKAVTFLQRVIDISSQHRLPIHQS